MRPKTYIFSAGFILILAALHVQPLFIQYGGVQLEFSCPKAAEPACSKSSCNDQAPAEEEKDCTNQGCNPFVPCSIGMCCYLVENPFSYSFFEIVSKQKLALVNDNRLQQNLSECWHPPEALS